MCLAILTSANCISPTKLLIRTALCTGPLGRCHHRRWRWSMLPSVYFHGSGPFLWHFKMFLMFGFNLGKPQIYPAESNPLRSNCPILSIDLNSWLKILNNIKEVLSKNCSKKQFDGQFGENYLIKNKLKKPCKPWLLVLYFKTLRPAE